MSYTGHSSQEESQLLEAIGVRRFEDLLPDLPDNLRLRGAIDIPPGQSEKELRDLFAQAEWSNYDPRLHRSINHRLLFIPCNQVRLWIYRQ